MKREDRRLLMQGLFASVALFAAAGPIASAPKLGRLLREGIEHHVVIREQAQSELVSARATLDSTYTLYDSAAAAVQRTCAVAPGSIERALDEAESGMYLARFYLNDLQVPLTNTAAADSVGYRAGFLRRNLREVQNKLDLVIRVADIYSESPRARARDGCTSVKYE